MQPTLRSTRMTIRLGSLGVLTLLANGIGIATEPQSTAPSAANAGSWTWKRSDSAVALMRGDQTVWQFNHGTDLHKPFFHPVATMDGQVLTWNSPSDHAWHHGKDESYGNYGANLKIWDQLHGTWHSSTEMPEELGVTHDLSLIQKLVWPFS